MAPFVLKRGTSDLSDLSEPDMAPSNEFLEDRNPAGTFTHTQDTHLNRQEYRAAVNSAFLASETDLRQYDLHSGKGALRHLHIGYRKVMSPPAIALILHIGTTESQFCTDSRGGDLPYPLWDLYCGKSQL